MHRTVIKKRRTFLIEVIQSVEGIDIMGNTEFYKYSSLYTHDMVWSHPYNLFEQSVLYIGPMCTWYTYKVLK